MGVKGSGRRPGEGYAEGWDAIFGKKKPACEYCNDSGVVDEDLPDSGLTVINCPMCTTEESDDAKDAARYRWLRDRSNAAYFRAPMVFMCDNGDKITWSDARMGEELDAALDIAIKRLRAIANSGRTE